MLSPDRANFKFWAAIGLDGFWETCQPTPTCFDNYWPSAPFFVFIATVGYTVAAWLMRRCSRAGAVARAVLALVALAMSMIMSFLVFPAEGNFRNHKDDNTAHRRIYTATMMVSSLLAVASVALVYNVWIAAGRDGIRSSPTLTRTLGSRADKSQLAV
jgi:hypothetical protein